MYKESWDVQIKTLLTESKLFGITIFGDRATIKTVPLVNVLAAGVNNPFALLDVADCMGRAAQAKKKDASYIASLVDPLILKLEDEVHSNRLQHTGIVDLVYFDDAKMYKMLVSFLLQNTPASQSDTVLSMLCPSSFLTFSIAQRNTEHCPSFTRFAVIFGEE